MTIASKQSFTIKFPMVHSFWVQKKKKMTTVSKHSFPIEFPVVHRFLVQIVIKNSVRNDVTGCFHAKLKPYLSQIKHCFPLKNQCWQCSHRFSTFYAKSIDVTWHVLSTTRFAPVHVLSKSMSRHANTLPTMWVTHADEQIHHKQDRKQCSQSL